jgi:hypothetical protein
MLMSIELQRRASDSLAAIVVSLVGSQRQACDIGAVCLGAGGHPDENMLG